MESNPYFMYKFFIRPILFRFKPEFAHQVLFSFLKIMPFIPLLSLLLRKIYRIDNKKLHRYVMGIHFDNPVGLAAGLDKNALVCDRFYDFGFSFVEIGTVTPLPQPGNPKPRLFRLVRDKAIINRMGFNNDGIETVVSRLKMLNKRIIIGANIGKNTATDNKDADKDYLTCLQKVYHLVDYIAINISCPNIKNMEHLQENEHLDNILKILTQFRNRQEIYKPFALKISPDLDFEQIDNTLGLIAKYNIDGVIATNTTILRNGLKVDQNFINKTGSGGLSGLPLRDRSTQVIRYIHKKTDGKLPIIGVGGIHSPDDAMEKLNAGAVLLQLYTGIIYQGPGLVKKVNKHILIET